MTIWKLTMYFIQAVVIFFLYLDEKIEAGEIGQE